MEKPTPPEPGTVEKAKERLAAIRKVVSECEFQDHHGYGCPRDMEPLTEPCEECGVPEQCKLCLERTADGDVIEALLAALSVPSGGSPSEIDRIQSEHAEMQWALENVHMLARRALNASTEAKCREKLPHILRICEQQSPKPLGGSVLRESVPSGGSQSQERPHAEKPERRQVMSEAEQQSWADLQASGGLPEAQALKAEIHRCRTCGGLWRRWPDGTFSLIDRCGPCCDNAPMGEQIQQLWPTDQLVADLASALKGMQEYVQHLKDCKFGHARWDELDAGKRQKRIVYDHPCTCGLSALLARVDS